MSTTTTTGDETLSATITGVRAMHGPVLPGHEAGPTTAVPLATLREWAARAAELEVALVERLALASFLDEERDDRYDLACFRAAPVSVREAYLALGAEDLPEALAGAARAALAGTGGGPG